jgi:hypothetical protein
MLLHSSGQSQPSVHCRIGWKWLQDDCWQLASNSNFPVFVTLALDAFYNFMAVQLNTGESFETTWN